ncbi:MAG: hypothetical protein K0R18_832 [Bacillales bacterium]|jgi:hypothetical protein|nr:hypothetical protein [Bacillales bacterium]
MMKDIKSQITEMVQFIKQYYIERNPENIEKLQNLLFDANEAPIIIGTSTDEWCFGIEQANQLFLSDWEGWGNVSIDMDTLTIEEVGSMAWFHVKSGVEFCFEDSVEKYVRYMDSVLRIAKNDKTPLAKAGEITWLLSHLLHSRESGERKYIWDMTITGIVQIIEGRPIVKVMQFSLPVKATFPDVRIDTDESMLKMYQSECGKIVDFGRAQISNKGEKHKIKISKLFEDDGSVYFVQDELKRFIGIDGVVRNGNEFKEHILSIKKNNQTAQISNEHIILNQNSDEFYFCGSGTFSRSISLESELDKILHKVDIYNEMDDKKEALFRIRRDLSQVLKDAALSDKCVMPFRIEGMGRVLGEDQLCLSYAQVSYPFYWFLEGKMD